MRVARIVSLASCALASTMSLGQGCPDESLGPVGGGDDGGGDAVYTTDDFTETEKAAISAAANGSTAALGQATNTTQSVTGDTGDSEQGLPSDICAGTCPLVCKSGSILQGAVDISIDFGIGCQAFPLVAVDHYVCSGIATGSFDQSARAVNLTFDTVSCEGETINGTADLTWDLSVSDVEFTGDWDLTWASDEGWTATTTGDGTGGYDFVSDITSVPTFIGSVSDLSDQSAPYVWSIEMTDVLISYVTYYSFLPYSGEITMSGPDIRTLALTFDESSPSTGDVQVSIAGAPAFTVNVYTLLYYE